MGQDFYIKKNYILRNKPKHIYSTELHILNGFIDNI